MLSAQFAIVTVLLLPYLSVVARQSREYYSDECSPSCQVSDHYDLLFLPKRFVLFGYESCRVSEQ